jgi:hypothetical protein
MIHEGILSTIGNTPFYLSHEPRIMVVSFNTDY